MFVHIRALETPRTPARRLTHRPGGWGWVTLLLPMSNPINHIATSSPLSPREQRENAERPMGGTGAPDYILETLPRTRRCGWKLLGLGCKIEHPKKPPFTPINQLNGIQMLNEPSQGSLTQGISPTLPVSAVPAIIMEAWWPSFLNLIFISEKCKGSDLKI